jgi:hypothetical protein
MTDKPFRIWDAITLQEAAKIAIQLGAIIDETCRQNKTIPAMLPPSLIPTEKLYILAASFDAAYNKLIEYELTKTGNLRSDKDNIH